MLLFCCLILLGLIPSLRKQISSKHRNSIKVVRLHRLMYPSALIPLKHMVSGGVAAVGALQLAKVNWYDENYIVFIIGWSIASYLANEISPSIQWLFSCLVNHELSNNVEGLCFGALVEQISYQHLSQSMYYRTTIQAQNASSGRTQEKSWSVWVFLPALIFSFPDSRIECSRRHPQSIPISLRRPMIWPRSRLPEQQ